MYRSRHSAPDLVWSERLQKAAQDWADNCWFQHSRSAYGENLALGYPAISAVVDAWYAENAVYDYDNPSFNAGHFTALVWAKTSMVGCAIGVCPQGVSYEGGVWIGKLYVCMYFPPGNNLGGFKDNVFPPISGGRRRQAQQDGEL
ncbi:hypothetical protein HYH03_001851 [Edaphochlamys debaryana]|uniref:SCP domain-containing protein n=1 Tax=Edaphochlamys debaryana TaxID=47281 RepID=A0A835YFI2_9CHLO|nr:hypothetical protein HYH03_001851 [Edaphochlamys debaryana]|eukprot:KAG2500273.1 hypothetical protein HYH03_001851 [Edaphochlamys debaryana]